MIGLRRQSMYECVGSRSVCRPRKRWIGTVKDCLRIRGLDVRQARMVHDRSQWRRFVSCEGECLGRSPGDEPLTDEMPQLYEALGWKSVLPRLQFGGHKGEKFLS